MSLLTNILLFLPLNLAICIVSSALRRQDMGDVIRHGLRVFAYMSGTIILASLVIHFAMEWLLTS